MLTQLIAESSKPEFILIVGGSASGKNYHYEQNFPNITLVDVDVVMKKLGSDRSNLQKAISQTNAEMKKMLDSKTSFAQTTVGISAKTLSNKIKKAHDAGFQVRLILIDVNVQRAIKQNQKRAESGMHSVPDWKIEKTNKEAKENFKAVKNLADVAQIVKR